MKAITRESFRGKKIMVMGLGLFEGGVGVTRFLVDQGADVIVTDLKVSDELGDSVEKLRGLPVAYHLGEHRDQDFSEVDAVIVNPAVPKDSPYLVLARENEVPLLSEMNIFFQLCPAPIIGVTGSNGKSTTTALVYEMVARGERRTWLGGNIGQALLPESHKISPGDVVVLELSSFQLEDLQQIKESPHVSLVTNVAPNHLDRHGTMEAYIAAKKGILIHQGKRDFAVLNADDAEVKTWAKDTRGQSLFFSREEEVDEGAFVHGDQLVLRVEKSEEVISLKKVQIPGRHNRQNIAAAAVAARIAGIGANDIESAASAFQGLEHRIELFEEIGGVKFYNDSIATTPESAIAAMDSVAKPIVLIAGGYDKGTPFDAFARKIAGEADAVVLIGKTAPKIGKLVEKERKKAGRPEIFHEGTLEGAVRRALDAAAAGGSVLLSPGCASYDMFRNFADRGRQFKRLARALKGEASSAE